MLHVIGVLTIASFAAVAPSLPASAIVTTPTTGGATAPIAQPTPVTNPTTSTTDEFVNRSFGTSGSSTARPDASVTTPATPPPTTGASSPPTNQAVTAAPVGTGREWQASGPEFDFSTTDIGRLGALGLAGVAGGWFVIAAGRRRRDEAEDEHGPYDGFAPNARVAVIAGPAVTTLAPPAPAATAPAAVIPPLYLDRRQRRERRKLRNRLFHRDPSVDRRTENRRQRRR